MDDTNALIATLKRLLYWGGIEEYADADSSFRAFLDRLPDLDIEALPDMHQAILVRYATRCERCDLIDLWLPRVQGDGIWLHDFFVYQPTLLTVLPRLLVSGRPTLNAVKRLLEHEETWPYLVYNMPYPWADALHHRKMWPAKLWQFFCEAIGPAVVADPRILYRALEASEEKDVIPTIWHYVTDKEHALDYRGEIGTIRELFSVRHICGLEGLPPVPSDCPLLAPVFRGEAVVDVENAIPSAARVSEELAEYIRLRVNHRDLPERDLAHFNSLSMPGPHATRRERQRAYLVLNISPDRVPGHKERYIIAQLETLLQ